MRRIKASIIVPALNEEKRIIATLKALSKQTIPRSEYEIIVSDSSSEDKTVKVSKKYVDKIVVCRRQSAGYGRNQGAKKARGGVLGFVDADTTVGPQWVEGLIGCLSDGKTIACTGPIDNIEKDSLKINLFYKVWNIQSRFSRYWGYPVIPGFNFGVRAKEFWRAKGFPEANQMCEDLELSVSLGKIGKIGYCKEMVVSTSARRQKEFPIFWHIFSGVRYALTKKSVTWDDYRKDFALHSKTLRSNSK